MHCALKQRKWQTIKPMLNLPLKSATTKVRRLIHQIRYAHEDQSFVISQFLFF